MKNTEPKFYRPFKKLASLMDRDALPSKPSAHLVPLNDKQPNAPENEKQLFLEAMAGVKPMARDNIAPVDLKIKMDTAGSFSEDMDVLVQLKRLLKFGDGFVVAHTPEYIEGIGFNVSPEIPALLHKGKFSIQDYIDLHGFSLKAAEDAFENFLKQAIRSGKRAVLIIHGRGLSSQGKPVLKEMVAKKLLSNYWRRRVIAFTSARLCDGGTGATYILLRNTRFSFR